ncbi:DUF934 domain-containing protein [Actibacterium sp. 188UL27-1]|uniref:DUF934 domain-containing protein n=1 Tax=Actibacterium sp. 188UL27-1 TaxID=2786961 RepID=UPI00195D5FFC|nr:DUF934 domain-containing protein [Actibacterium sp. 188UL27-1]MBM7070251.1 DUF934 domain-containing protein [Actibacterium sp. 188UL27-1]
MAVIVTDQGFGPDDWTGCFATPQTPAANAKGLDLASDARAEDVALDGVDLIRIDFPSFADGRGFSIARALRRLGYTGRLRAKGHVIADQYAMARRSGFDEVEIDQDLAKRQPEDQWLARANWQEHDYRARLRG